MKKYFSFSGTFSSSVVDFLNTNGIDPSNIVSINNVDNVYTVIYWQNT